MSEDGLCSMELYTYIVQPHFKRSQ